jgi:hypothetical protein
MRLYIELAKKPFQHQVAYRTATLAGLITNMFFGVLRVSAALTNFLMAIVGSRPRRTAWCSLA